MIVALGDQPLINLMHIGKLIQSYKRTGKVIASGLNDTIGVPALFPRETWHNLLKLEGDHGAQMLLLELPGVIIVDMDNGLDIDRPEDLADLN